MQDDPLLCEKIRQIGFGYKKEMTFAEKKVWSPAAKY